MRRGLPGAEPVPGVVRVRALGRARACVPVPAAERWEWAAAEGRVPVAGRRAGLGGELGWRRGLLDGEFPRANSISAGFAGIYC